MFLPFRWLLMRWCRVCTREHQWPSWSASTSPLPPPRWRRCTPAERVTRRSDVRTAGQASSSGSPVSSRRRLTGRFTDHGLRYTGTLMLVYMINKLAKILTRASLQHTLISALYRPWRVGVATERPGGSWDSLQFKFRTAAHCIGPLLVQYELISK